MKQADEQYVGIPWKDGGRNFAGADCVGLTCLWLTREAGFTAPVPSSQPRPGELKTLLADHPFVEKNLTRGEVIFFAHSDGAIRHVAVWLGAGKLLHSLRGSPSRIENGFTLARRVGMTPVAMVKPADAEILARALADKSLGWSVVIGIIVSIVFSIAAHFLMPTLARQGNKTGKYGFDGLMTQNSPEIPLPDILGEVTVAGNSPYTQLKDKNLTVSNPVQQAANKIVVLASGPVSAVDSADLNILVNGITYTDSSFFAGSPNIGITLNPAQTKAEAVSGSIGAVTYAPSMTIYNATPDISVPVDIRASYDRTFPVYGYSGCAYLVFRLFNSTIFTSFNLNARVQGRLCRTYDNSGFIVTTATAETLAAGDGSTKRFLFANSDVAAVSAVTVNGTAQTQMDASHQSGAVFHLNATKGFIEFVTAPAAAASVVATYTYYTRAWTQCPADHLVYLLTEKGRGKGFDAGKIDWVRAVAFQTYCNTPVTWTDSSGMTTNPRYTTNYAIDFRKPIQEHIQVICDAACAYLFLSGGKFVMKARASDTSIFSFNEGNILKDSFQSTLIDRAQMPNRLKLFFHDQNTYNSETEVDLDDAADQANRAARIGNDGVVEQTLKYPAIDNQQQAQRVGQVLLREASNVVWTGTLKTTVLALALEPGDIIDVTHSSQPAWAAKLFRVDDLQYGDDDRLEVAFSEYFDGAYI